MIDRKVKAKVLFIADKWCAGNPAFGLSEWEGNLWTSLKTLDSAEVNVFHLDAYYQLQKHRGDAALLQKIEEFKPDVICLILYNMPGSDNNVPEWATLETIRDVLNIPMIAIWGDLEIPEQVEISEALRPFVKLHAATASSAGLVRMSDPMKYLYMWVPKDPMIFLNTDRPRDIDLSYLGTQKHDRLRRVSGLIRDGQSVFCAGGERGEHLTTMEYAEIFRRSKITLSFSRATFSHVINARPFEAMLCGAMVLEQEGLETPKLFTPFVDYVPYFSDKDLLEKARYYLARDEERRQIAHNGRLKTETLYSAERFWRLLLSRALDVTSTDDWGRRPPCLADADLSRLSSWQRQRWTLFDRVCSMRFAYCVYFSFRSVTNLAFLKFRIDTFLKKKLSPTAYAFIRRMKRKIFNRSAVNA